MSGMSVTAYRASTTPQEETSDASSAAPGSASAQPPSSSHSSHPPEFPEPTALSLSLEEQGLLEALLAGRLTQPFGLLGPRYASQSSGVSAIRAFHPGAAAVRVRCRHSGALLGELQQFELHGQPSGFFSGVATGLDQRRHQVPYVLEVDWLIPDGSRSVQSTEDPYAFGLLLGELDLHLLREGRHRQLADCLGARPMDIDGVPGTRFAVWAPNAERVSVVGDFNQWDGRRHVMRLRHESGVWELFIPRIGPGDVYKYEILGRDGALLPLKADPVARATEPPPATASVVADARPYLWQDQQWMAERAQRQSLSAPMSIYELHPASWRRIPEQAHRNLSWDELADELIPYVVGMGFTHIELMPVMEHPFGGSWGYQPISMFAPSARFGKPERFAAFVDRCHQAGIGVLLDWVPAHFPSDQHGLAQFDGTALYEHADPREGFHQDWNTLIFNLGRNEVRGFLIASALEWIEHFHVDGLRVDAVASMLYRDYSRKSGEWVPNIHGGRENLEAVAFLRELNTVVAQRCPGVLMIAEESTSWPGVTSEVSNEADHHGLGFSYKWNMGWMNDTLRYMQHDPLFRRYHHHDMTFGLLYGFSENFILPISHDEVVHGKRALLNKMPGDEWRRFANVRAYYGFMWTHPGKKLLFMGSEFGQPDEFDHDKSPYWHLLNEHGDHPAGHRQLRQLVSDLNHLYRSEPALHQRDCRADGFSWAVGDDSVNSVLAYFRYADEGPPVLIVVNLTPVPRTHYRIGVPPIAPGHHGVWREVLNTDAAVYGGSNSGNMGQVQVQEFGWHGHPTSIELNLPPLSTLILRRES
ncbi:1,4-alpha-glucan branching protein GlgB [Herbaspirillum huttiense]|uniref:1,4-alpha-glucan branching protein GlgB n=1 Tax=Herbaspirillum huttiense TaxID=863372 RepID=UPI003801507E